MSPRSERTAARNTFRVFVGAALGTGLLGAGSALAGGIILYEVGTPDVGRASGRST